MHPSKLFRIKKSGGKTELKALSNDTLKKYNAVIKLEPAAEQQSKQIAKMVSTYVEAFVITPAEKASSASEEERKKLKKKDSEAEDEDDSEEEKVIPFKSGLKAS